MKVFCDGNSMFDEMRNFAKFGTLILKLVNFSVDAKKRIRLLLSYLVLNVFCDEFNARRGVKFYWI